MHITKFFAQNLVYDKLINIKIYIMYALWYFNLKTVKIRLLITYVGYLIFWTVRYILNYISMLLHV